MPTTLWFSMLALVYVVGMAGYHGFYLVSQHIVPEPRARQAPGWRTVLVELLATAMILAPLLRRVLPTLSWIKGASTITAAAFYVLAFAWLPLLKAASFLMFRPGERRERSLRLLYSVPLSVLYIMGVAYLLFVTVTMMLAR